MKNLLKLFFCIALLLSLTACFESKEVKKVKGGVLQMCPNHTVEQMVNGFMGSPSWKSGKSPDGKVFVNIEGDITFHEKPVRAMVQFIVVDDNFSFGAFEMNGVPSENVIAIGLLGKMCESAKGTLPQQTAEKTPEPVAPSTSNQISLAEYNAEVPAPRPVVSMVAQAPISDSSTGICADIYKQPEEHLGANDIACSNHEFDIADKELNAVYKVVMSALSAERKTALKKEQILWIKDKEKQCQEAANGAINDRQITLSTNACLLKLTVQRTAYLKELQ